MIPITPVKNKPIPKNNITYFNVDIVSFIAPTAKIFEDVIAAKLIIQLAIPPTLYFISYYYL